MKNKKVKFKTAKLARDKNFQWRVRGSWGTDITSQKKFYEDEEVWSNRQLKSDKNGVTRPTQTVLQKWLRESTDLKWAILVYVVPFFSEKPRQEQCFIVRRDKTIKLEPKDTYEEALEEGLQEGLKLIE